MTAAEYIQGLRDFADWVEQHADEIPKSALGTITMLLAASDRDDFVTRVALLDGQGQTERDSTYLKVIRQFGPVTVQVYSSLGNVGVVETHMKRVEVTEWEPFPELRPILDAFQGAPA